MLIAAAECNVGTTNTPKLAVHSNVTAAGPTANAPILQMRSLRSSLTVSTKARGLGSVTIVRREELGFLCCDPRAVDLQATPRTYPSVTQRN